MDPNKILRKSGFDIFPVVAPRWEITGEDVYGTMCPGMVAIGDVKMLQTLQKRKSQAIEKIINPPMIGPAALKSVKTSILPGDITYSDEREGRAGFRPIHEINFPVGDVSNDIREVQFMIRRAFYEDLFLMLATSDRRQITATEIDERKEEKLIALGPVLEQLNQDLLDPLIDITFPSHDPTQPKEFLSLSHERNVFHLQRNPLKFLRRSGNKAPVHHVVKRNVNQWIE